MMNSSKLPIKKLDPKARVPERAHEGDAGLDLFSLEDATLTHSVPVRVRTGIAMALNSGFVGLICDRSSMGAKGIRTLGGVVDAGYRGEVQVLLINLTNEPYMIHAGDKIAQMLILPIATPMPFETDSLDDTSRSSGGFGSTGR